jgi:hypothetical protein
MVLGQRHADFAIEFLDVERARNRIFPAGVARHVAARIVAVGGKADALVAIFGAQRHADRVAGHRQGQAKVAGDRAADDGFLGKAGAGEGALHIVERFGGDAGGREDVERHAGGVGAVERAFADRLAIGPGHRAQRIGKAGERDVAGQARS